MHYFSKMVQEKRLKILILVVILTLSRIYTSAIQPPDLNLVIKRIEPLSEPFISPLCIATGNTSKSGIAWIYPTPKSELDLPEERSYFSPVIKNDFDCTFSKSKPCSKSWKINGWQLSKFYTNNFEPTLDTRWEGFQTFLTTPKMNDEFGHRIDIPSTFSLGISVRISKNAEILLCEGWNPKRYACYYLNVGEKNITLNKLRSLSPQKENEAKICDFQSDVNLIGEEEWNTFALSLDRNGVITIVKKHEDRLLLNCTDVRPLKPVFLFIKSSSSSGLWKIHNNQYIFTNTSQVSQLGPSFKVLGGRICISMYVAMCSTCSMSFFIKSNNEQRVLKKINFGATVWKEIKIEEDDVLADNTTLFLETRNEGTSENFWALDDIRLCYKNEIKITTLDLKKQTNETATKLPISCQVLKSPFWRPTPHVLTVDPRIDIKNSTLIATSTSISIPISSKLDEEYFVTYFEAKELCDSNFAGLTKRHLSQGFIITENNDIHLTNLVPYTLYKISVEHIILGISHDYEYSTLPTDVPTKYELPRNVTMQITNTTNTVSWKDPRCNETFGLLVYQLKIEEIGSTNVKTVQGFTTEYKFVKLKPYTNYSLEILTARSIGHLNHSHLSVSLHYNFTTLAGVPAAVRNLELYAIGRNSASLRYNLPNPLRGVPESLQIRTCLLLYSFIYNSCQTSTQDVTTCEFWPNKYCINLQKLKSNSQYVFEVSLKVKNVSILGESSSLRGVTADKVPGVPSNITFQMIGCNESDDFCHLNLGWAHPYYQNGDITYFEVMLTESSGNKHSDTLKTIHEILPINDQQYDKTYFIVIKYIPYSTHYNVSIRAANDKFKGDYATEEIKTDAIENYIDQTPEFINSTVETLTFRMPKLDWRLTSSLVTVLVQGSNEMVAAIDETIKKLIDFELCQNFRHTWIAKVLKIEAISPREIVIGDGTLSYLPSLNKTVKNVRLEPSKIYCVTFVIENRYRETSNRVIYHVRDVSTTGSYSIPQEEVREDNASKSSSYLVFLLLCATMLTCGLWILYRRHKQFSNQNTNGHNSEPIYESMPFDEYVSDAVFNETYDRLVHE